MDIFKNFKSTIKYRPVRRDNEVFQLHYRVTAVLLAALGAMIASKQHFGDPIDCISNDDVPEKLLETYCWIQGTFTIPRVCNGTLGKEIPHPCIETYKERYYNLDQSKERIYHSWYQWVYFVLFFQAICFYAPNLCWKSCESKLLLTLTSNVKDPVVKEESKRKEHLTKLTSFFVDRAKVCKSVHNRYFYIFFGCEVANLANVFAQWYLVNRFLGGNFTDYGWNSLIRAFADSTTEDPDPMEVVFPKMTKCTFRRFGPSGDVNQYDALCILPLNILNEKIYVIMWFWFIILGGITFIWIIYRIATCFKPKVRSYIIRKRVGYVDGDLLNFVLNRMEIGDWFLLSMISKNIDHIAFAELLQKISKEYDIIESKDSDLISEESDIEAQLTIEDKRKK